MSENIECKIEHFGITVTNLENSIKFYGNNFGFEKIRVADKPDLKLKLATLQLGNSYLELLQPYKSEKQKTKKEKQNINQIKEKDLPNLLQKTPSHIAIGVNNIIEIYNKLMENKVEFASYFNFMKSKSFFCYDPDNFLIEVRQR